MIASSQAKAAAKTRPPSMVQASSAWTSARWPGTTK